MKALLEEQNKLGGNKESKAGALRLEKCQNLKISCMDASVNSIGIYFPY